MSILHKISNKILHGLPDSNPIVFFFQILNRFWLPVHYHFLIRHCRKNQTVYLKPVAPPGGKGTPQNFYHFVLDAALPIFYIIQECPNTQIILNKEYIGTFGTNLLDFFPDTIALSEQTSYASKSLYGMSPLHVRSSFRLLENFKNHVGDKLNVDLNQASKQVIIIERGETPSHKLSKYQQLHGSGANRRSIVNHAEWVEFLKSMIKEPYSLKNIKLEGLSFSDQIALFDQSKLVIGQHGAGLANISWMQPNSTVIEINNERWQKHFRRLSNYKLIDHFTYYVKDKHSNIDLNEFRLFIRSNQKLHQFFDVNS